MTSSPRLTWTKLKLESRGWSVTEQRVIGDLWIAEIWKIRSTWSPSDLFAYLVFSTDPQGPSNEFETITWLSALARPPIDWSRDAEETGQRQLPDIFDASTPIGKHQEKHFGKFLEALDRWRLQIGRE